MTAKKGNARETVYTLVGQIPAKNTETSLPYNIRMGKRKNSNHELEQYSRGRFFTRFSEWVLNSLADEDYAFDFEVRPRRGLLASRTEDPPDTVSQSPFYVQLKAHEDFENSESVYHDFTVDYLVEDCLRASVPVVLMVYERANDEFSWCVLQNYCWDVLDAEKEGWRDQETVRVRIEQSDRDAPSEPSETDAFFERSALRDAVGETRRRISMRKHVSIARRGTFDAPPEIELASTSDVVEYKYGVVIDALEFAEAGDRERARERLMEVYQMPEEDEARLEARHQLLQLKEINAPAIAFTTMRFALEGHHWSTEYGRDELTGEFEDHYTDALEYVNEHVVGATYVDSEMGIPFQILEVRQRGNAANGDISYIARVDDTGLSDRHVMGIGEESQFELVETGEGTHPREDACAEREHKFEREEDQQSLAYSNCSKCGLSYEVISQWLEHDVPEICEGCQSVSYDVASVLENTTPPTERLLCSDCRE